MGLVIVRHRRGINNANDEKECQEVDQDLQIKTSQRGGEIGFIKSSGLSILCRSRNEGAPNHLLDRVVNRTRHAHVLHEGEFAGVFKVHLHAEHR